MATVIAFDDVHASVVEPPTAMTDGVAVSVTVGGGTTVTRTDAEEAPAVSVYVVDCDGDTVTDPLAGF